MTLKRPRGEDALSSHGDHSEETQTVPASTGTENWCPGDVLINEYEVERILGKGGMGIVYLVRRMFDESRFAVKTLHESSIEDTVSKRTFIRELRTWLTVPEHPNLTACRFFKTIEDRICIFAEYVDGASLRDWIEGGRLTDPRDLLDVAIQFAWGLHLTHQCSIVHQDVKPGNVLMTLDGRPKITDFGLARALEESRSTTLSSGDPAVSAGGMTMAYCSPEQAQGEKLTFRTDMWSWAVSVFHMYTQQRTWRIGFMMPSVLENYMLSRDQFSGVTIPDPVLMVLGRCLEPDPGDRWSGMDEIVDRLREVYRELFGEEYSVELQGLGPLKSGSSEPYQRITHGGGNFDDPRIWQEKAYAYLGKRVPKTSDTGTSRQTKLLTDLEIYEEAATIFGDLLKREGTPELIRNMAEVLRNMAILRSEMGDFSGALETFARANRYWDRMPVDMMDDLAIRDRVMNMQNMGIAHMRAGNFKATLAQNDEAISVLLPLLKRTEPPVTVSFHRTFAMLCANNGAALNYLGEPRDALKLYEQAEVIFRRICRTEGDDQDQMVWAVIDQNIAVILSNLGKLPEAEYHAERALKVLEELVLEQGLSQHKGHLASAYNNMAKVIGEMGMIREAIPYMDKAIDVLKDLVLLDKHVISVQTLIWSYSNKTRALGMLKDFAAAEKLSAESIGILRDQIDNQGRSDLLPMLLTLSITALDLKLDSGELDGMDALLENAWKVLERNRSLEGSGDHHNKHLVLQLFEAVKLARQNKKSDARTLAETTLAALHRENDRTGIQEYRERAEYLQQFLKNL